MNAPKSSIPAQGNRRPFSRADHRARNHETAHEEASIAPEVVPPPDHPLVPAGEPELITSDLELKRWIGELRAEGAFAYDSEFIGELTYYPKLCLIQTASTRKVKLIDPLAALDLTPFWELLCDPAVEKVVHAGQQDIEPVIRNLARPPANVFDTQITAGFIALPYPVSLSKLVHELTGVKLGKGLTFTHWDQRPLSAVQLRYAADDVRYLLMLRAEIGRRLEQWGHTLWARAECDAQCDTSLYRFDPRTQYLRVRGASSLQPRNLAILRELTIWRDAMARQQDVPPRSFLRDEVLLDLARSPAKSIERLSRVRGLPRPVEARHGATIVEITQGALNLPADHIPISKESEPTPTERFRADALFAAAQCLCAGRGIDFSLVASRQDVSDFHRALGPGDFTDIRIMQGWRRQALGDTLLQLLRREARFCLCWDDDLLKVTNGDP